ncbi:ABC transporter permease [Sinomonas atrocyanea]|jgi:ribose transport system permease protein|uniref:ABC transporter permease n=1 Tax=Sinomonas atrocyanea TaxID=37927 RepID=UPI002782E7AF|nr:ABC transporter permease [Sinomonas atrocyanea]MDQ0261743.1 ribose transport system permease protein [Sinomonas atrocyanea]MDR6623441.1 ribose transport system permease protein [Sinomonas atrocyanea]
MTANDSGTGLLDPVPAQKSPTPSRRRFDVKNLGEAAALIALIVVFAALNPTSFLSPDNARTILDHAALPLVIGVGSTLVILTGSIDLSVEGIMGAAGMAFVLLSANSRGTADLGFWAIPAALAVGAGLGLVNGLVHTRLKVPSFIVTLGVWFVGLGIATLLFGQASIPFLSDQGLKSWPTSLTLGIPNSFLLAAMVALLGIGVTRFTRLGRFAYAIGDSEEIARANGVPVGRYKVYVFVAAGACSAGAGILASLQLGAGSATVGTGNLFLTIAAVVIGGTSLAGGKGGILRTAVGVLMLTVLNNGLILSGVSPNLQSAVSGAVLIAAVLAAAWPHRSRLRIVK